MNYWRSGEAKVGDDHGGNNLLKMKPKICKTIKKNKKKKGKEIIGDFDQTVETQSSGHCLTGIRNGRRRSDTKLELIRREKGETYLN